jgi:signal transduction histidine kinase
VELPKSAERSSSTALLLVTIVVVGIFILSFFSVQAANDRNRQNLEERAAAVAAALDAHTILKLSGTAKDTTTTEYKSLKSRLIALKQINSDARDVYLAGRTDGHVFFYVDSEQPGSSLYSPPGEVYTDATAAFKNMFFSSPVPMVEGPVSDRYGSWVSGLAPIFNPDTGRVLAVVGIEVDAVSYNQALLGALDFPIGGGLILLATVGAYEWRRRRDAQMLQLRSELVSIASHELRSPLVGMRWAIEGLLKSVSNKAEEEKLRAIYNSIIHLQAGAEDILQFTALNRGSQKLQKAPCDMKALVQEIMDTQRLVAEQKKVKLAFDDSWPEKVMITCDADRLKRALHNVVSNAIKYTRSNTEVTMHYDKVEKAHHISVIDHGIGIPKSEQKRVFAGFYRASNAKASGEGGTGLGLYLTRAILAQHGGKVGFASEEGKGTTLTLILPQA